ncbi:DNA-processing protein DprA [Nonomuraea endophytica]|uniref:DNA-processing protein DprA n=1 Tax=Nonomuraea endophytica TaxID=714136 RepID=UPI0037CA595C
MATPPLAAPHQTAPPWAGSLALPAQTTCLGNSAHPIGQQMSACCRETSGPAGPQNILTGRVLQAGDPPHAYRGEWVQLTTEGNLALYPTPELEHQGEHACCQPDEERDGGQRFNDRATTRDATASDAQEARLRRRLRAWQARLEAADPEADLAAGEKAGARLIIPGTPEWPTQLDQLGTSRPLGLWVNGTADLRYSCLRSVSIVGARAATPYGLHVAAEFAAGMAESGWTVISGGALGIDGAAHRGTLTAGGTTIAILACGVDISYPSGHHDLFAEIKADGAVISECPPGVHPTRARFLIRNRLIAALSRGTLVVEAALRSGAANTAAHALTLSRHLAVVPGPVTSEMSAGCHRLLRDRKAVCVTTPAELIDLVGMIGDDLAPTPRGPVVPHDALSETARSVLDAVPGKGGAGTATIAVAAGTDLSTTLSALGSLAAAGYVLRTAKGWRLKPGAFSRP